jgi:hypothetical protein
MVPPVYYPNNYPVGLYNQLYIRFQTGSQRRDIAGRKRYW